MLLISELQNLEGLLAEATLKGDENGHKLIEGWIADLKADPDFALESQD